MTNSKIEDNTPIREFSRPVVEKVAIVGGGPGGLATAIALRKQGIDAHVYERARQFLRVGAGLSLARNGLNCLDAIEPDLVSKLKEKGSLINKINSKTPVGETTLPVTTMEKYGQPLLAISWFALQEVLASALPPETIHLNHRCIGFSQNHDSVTVQLDGGKTVKADLLIGADGINSAVRQTLIGDLCPPGSANSAPGGHSGEPPYAGWMLWRGVVKYSHELLPANQITFFATEGKRIIFADIGGGYIYWPLGVFSGNIFKSGNAAQVKERVLAEVAGWASPVPEIISATDADAIGELPTYHRLPLSSWSQGRVTLLGDAAHAMVPFLGQGTNTAFEDAWELMLCLSHAVTVEAALKNYERRRIERTQNIQARSLLAGYRGYHLDLDIQYLEKQFGRVPPQVRVSDDEFSRWLYGYDPEAIASYLKPSHGLADCITGR